MFHALLLVLLPTLVCASPAAPPLGYVQHQMLGFEETLGPEKGSLRLLWDEGLEQAFQARNGDARGLAYEYPDPESGAEAKPALLQVLDAAGAVQQTFTLEKPVASLKRSELEGPGPVFEVEVDYSAGFGSYNGPITFFLAFDGKKAAWLMARDAETGEQVKMEAMSSLKTAWDIIDSRTLLKAACRPDLAAGQAAEEGQAFLVHYYRYSLTKAGWTRFHRQKAGFMEFEDAGLPPRSEFP